MNLGLVQFSPAWESKGKNMQLVSELTANLKKDTDMLVFPEMTMTGFTMKSTQYGEEIDGESINFFMNLSANLKVDIIAGIIEKDGRNYFNSLFHFDSMGLLKAVYRKIHPFSLADEDKYFSRGCETVTTSFDTHKIGLSICYDLRFPELYRFYAKEKAALLINIANWPIKRIEHWKHLLKARAIENQCFVVGVNRMGKDPFHSYNGCSAVYGPMGEEIVLLENDEKIIYTEIDFNAVNEIRQNLGFLDDIKLI